MGNYNYLIYVFAVIVIIAACKFFFGPVKKMFKVVLNSAIGAALLSVVNAVGTSFNFHVGVNWWTILCVGILGVPGVALVIALKLFI